MRKLGGGNETMIEDDMSGHILFVVILETTSQSKVISKDEPLR